MLNSYFKSLFYLLLVALLVDGCKKKELSEEPFYSVPSINLVGSQVFVHIGGKYEDPGFFSTDEVDGDITANVVVDTVITSKADTLAINYKVTNSSGVSVSATRSVIVFNEAIGLAGRYKATMTNPYPGTKPVVFTDSIYCSSDTNKRIFFKNFANYKRDNVSAILATRTLFGDTLGFDRIMIGDSLSLVIDYCNISNGVIVSMFDVTNIKTQKTHKAQLRLQRY